MTDPAPPDRPSSPPRHAGRRIGAVQYLNTLPLVEGLQSVSFAVPAELASQYAAGRHDAALVPVAAAFTLPGSLVDGVAIACDGDCLSVFLAAQCAWDEIRRVIPDPASRSSSALARVLLPPSVEFGVPSDETLPRGETAVLIIGDRALRFRERHGAGFRYHDLGGIWRQQTGLPFVFAAWIVAPEHPEPKALSDLLRAARENGSRQIERIAREQKVCSPGLGLVYLRDHLRFELGEAEKRGIALFAEKMRQRGLLAAGQGSGFVWA